MKIAIETILDSQSFNPSNRFDFISPFQPNFNIDRQNKKLAFPKYDSRSALFYRCRIVPPGRFIRKFIQATKLRL